MTVQTIAIVATPIAMVLVAVITSLFNWNVNVSALRRDEDEKRGERILHLEERLAKVEKDHRADLDTADAQRRRCEAAVYALRGQILILRGALVEAGIALPKLPDVDY